MGAPQERRRFVPAVVLTGLHLALLVVAGVLEARGSASVSVVRLPSRVFHAMALVSMAGLVLFTVVLPRVRVRTPRILQDVVVAGASIVAIFAVASREGFNLSGIIATSAVLTAVIGFSLQDTLGNIIGGLALQMDDSIKVGDWIKVGDVTGKVSDIRWRYTAIETRNWETVILPNSLLLKGQVIVLGRRTGAPLQWRRWVWFGVDFRYQPSDVIGLVEEALRAAPIEAVAREPPPNCILMDLTESAGRYAVRYWLTDLAADDPTDSVVRTRICVALRRARIPLAIPAHAVFLTEESEDRKTAKSRQEHVRRTEALRKVELFASLTDADRDELAQGLRHAPFTRGEVLTRQGAIAHWLYMVIGGEVSVRVTAEGGLEREVARLGPGDFFGEMSLLTGEPRSATVVAMTDVECFRLDRSAFQTILERAPEMAEQVAEVLARRRVELVAVRDGLGQEARQRRLDADKHDILDKIRSFFGLGDSLPPHS
jgi:small-conductance mechanosensitive channel/CRP-like cAMP-binding protein